MGGEKREKQQYVQTGRKKSHDTEATNVGGFCEDLCDGCYNLQCCYCGDLAVIILPHWHHCGPH